MPGGGDHIGTGINADHLTARRDQLFRQHTIATAEVQNALTGLRVQEFQRRGAKYRDKPRVLLIAIRLPVLALPAHCLLLPPE